MRLEHNIGKDEIMNAVNTHVYAAPIDKPHRKLWSKNYPQKVPLKPGNR